MTRVRWPGAAGFVTLVAPSAERPALAIVVDEYAELAETAPAATSDADSAARWAGPSPSP